LIGLNYAATGGTRFEAVQRGNDALVHRVILILVRKIILPVLIKVERQTPIIISRTVVIIVKPMHCFTIKGASFAR
jgi:hypothetical protein